MTGGVLKTGFLTLFTRWLLGVMQVTEALRVVPPGRLANVKVGAATAGDVRTLAVEGGWGVAVKMNCRRTGGALDGC